MERRFQSITVRSWSESGDPAERLVAIAEQERVETTHRESRDARIVVAGARQRSEPRSAARALLP
jgi:hypothetical protein